MVKRYDGKLSHVENGGYVSYKDYAALQQKLDAMAAENATFKSNLMFWDAESPEMPYDCPEDIANNCCMDFNREFDVQVAAKMPNRTYRISEVSEYDCKIELVSGGMPETPATDAYLNSVRAEVIKSVPTVCDGKEQAAFEDYARSKGLDLSQHPLHYLFLDGKTNQARSAWRECLVYVASQLRAGTHDTTDKEG